jgi:hypothetical protein
MSPTVTFPHCRGWGFSSVEGRLNSVPSTEKKKKEKRQKNPKKQGNCTFPHSTQASKKPSGIVAIPLFLLPHLPSGHSLVGTFGT